MVLLQRKLYFAKDPAGFQHFPWGVKLFPGGGPDPLSRTLYLHMNQTTKNIKHYQYFDTMFVRCV